MKSKTMLYLAGVLALALLSFVVMGQRNAPVVAEKPREKPMFLAVAGDLQVGAFIEARDLEWREWKGKSDDLVLSRYFVKGATELEKVVIGGVLRMPLKAGEFLSSAAFVRAGDSAFLAAVLKPGTRATTIAIDAVSGSAGLIRPGNQVDIILANNPESRSYGEAGQYQARTLLSNVRVIAINRQVESLATSQAKEGALPESSEGTATLEVTPKQAEMLSLARGMGQLSLSLRSLVDDESAVAANAHGVTHANELIPQAIKASDVMPVEVKPTVTMLYGNDEK